MKPSPSYLRSAAHCRAKYCREHASLTDCCRRFPLHGLHSSPSLILYLKISLTPSKYNLSFSFNNLSVYHSHERSDSPSYGSAGMSSIAVASKKTCRRAVGHQSTHRLPKIMCLGAHSAGRGLFVQIDVFLYVFL